MPRIAVKSFIVFILAITMASCILKSRSVSEIIATEDVYKSQIINHSYDWAVQRLKRVEAFCTNASVFIFLESEREIVIKLKGDIGPNHCPAVIVLTEIEHEKLDITCWIRTNTKRVTTAVNSYFSVLKEEMECPDDEW